MRQIHGWGGGYEFIAYLDDDDEWLPEKLEKQLAKFQECDKNVAMVVSDCISFDDDENDDEKTARIVRSTPKKPKPVSQSKSVYIMAAKCGPTASPLIRVKCLDDVDGFDELMQSRQDWETWIRLMKRYEAVFIDEPLWIHHLHPGERIGTSFEKQLRGHERILSKHFAAIEDDVNEYWKLLIVVSRLYLYAGYFREAFSTLFRAINIKPFNITKNFCAFWDLSYGCMVISLKTWLKHKTPELFSALKRVKHKLKGEK